MYAIDLKVVTNCIAVLDSEGPDPKWIPMGDCNQVTCLSPLVLGYLQVSWRVFEAQGLFLTLTSVVLFGTVWLSLAAWEVIALSHSIKLMLALHPANEAFYHS